ncbi:MAG: glycosyltransferase family 4 protein [Geminicoccaceae bacterium]
MRVAIVTNNRLPPREGIGRHALETARSLRARGHEPILLAPGEGRKWIRGEIAGVPVRWYPHVAVRPFHHLLARREIGAWLADGAEGASLLHVHLPLLPPLPTSLPTVVTIHTPLLVDTAAMPEKGWRPFAFRSQARLLSHRWEQWYLDRAVSVIAVAQSVADDLARLYRLRGRHPLVVRNGVDTAFFAYRGPEGRFGRVLYVGRLGYRKGLSRLLAAVALLPNVLLRLVGEGPLETELKDQAQRLGIADRVMFLGFRDAEGVRRELWRAACFVNPADYESGPLTLLEAMAAGTPVVTTPTGLAVELGPDPPLRVVPPTAADLAAGIRATLDDPHSGVRTAAARALVVRGHDWERAVNGLEAAYGLRMEQAA